jgi:peroxiredoxin Q/BCP
MATTSKSRGAKTASKSAASSKPKVAAQVVKKTETARAAKVSASKTARTTEATKKAAKTPASTTPPKQARAAKASSGSVDVGSRAPAFELSDEKGQKVSSAALAGSPYLLYFYPKDDTPGCTKEACDIRDSFARFGQQGLRVLGVSPDSAASHAKFSSKYGLPFTLLSDPEKTLASAYGVWGKKQNYGREYMGIIRSSFLVGKDGTIKKAYRGVKVPGHVAEVLADAKALL